MTESTTEATGPPQPAEPAEPAEPMLDELLVEEVSIDGMCGVY